MEYLFQGQKKSTWNRPLARCSMPHIARRFAKELPRSIVRRSPRCSPSVRRCIRLHPSQEKTNRITNDVFRGQFQDLRTSPLRTAEARVPVASTGPTCALGRRSGGNPRMGRRSGRWPGGRGGGDRRRPGLGGGKKRGNGLKAIQNDPIIPARDPG